MPCRTCGSSLADDQRYCLECGSRNGPPRLDWKTMVMPADPAAGPDEQGDDVGPALPSPRIAAALVLGVLAFGAVVGHAAGPGAPAADAGGRLNLSILAPAPAPAPPGITTPAPAAEGAAPPDPSDPGATAPDGRASARRGAPPDAGSAPGDGGTPTADDTPAAEDTPAGDGGTAPDDAATGDGTTGDPATSAPKLPPVKHVWVIALTGHSYD